MLTALLLFFFRKRLIPFIKKYGIGILFILAASLYFIKLFLFLDGYR